MKIALSCDHRGIAASKFLAEVLGGLGHNIVQLFEDEEASSCDYPDRAFVVASAVANGQVDRGILICGSGIGMSIAANKIAGVRAALVHDEFNAELCRRHNDANVLCLSGDTLSMKAIGAIATTWTSTAFEGGRHERRLRKIATMERGGDPREIVDAGQEIPAPA